MTEKISGAVVRTDFDVYANVEIEVNEKWIRIHQSEHTELWIPRERIELIEVGRYE